MNSVTKNIEVASTIGCNADYFRQVPEYQSQGGDTESIRTNRVPTIIEDIETTYRKRQTDDNSVRNGTVQNKRRRERGKSLSHPAAKIYEVLDITKGNGKRTIAGTSCPTNTAPQPVLGLLRLLYLTGHERLCVTALI